MKIVVIGGGVVGLCCANYLARGDADVTLIERHKCGAAASWGNAGWITRSLSSPLAAPGAIRQSLLGMRKPNRAFTMRPRLDIGLARWGWRFARACSRKQFDHGSRALARLGQSTPALFDELRESGIEFEAHDTGLLFVADRHEVVEELVGHLLAARRAGYDGSFEVLDRAAIQRFEPALSDVVEGGIYVPAEFHVRPDSFTGALVRSLSTQGTTVVEDQEVLSLEQVSGASWRVGCVDDQLLADRVVIATGAWSGSLLRKLGLSLSMEPAKGYSITARNEGVSPRHPLYIADLYAACSPFDDGLRITGMLEFAGFDERVPPKRVDALHQAAAKYLRDWRPADEIVWSGFRPVPADGLPYIGQVPGKEGLFVATGHGTLGMTLGPATGAALAPLVLRGERVPELEPFRLEGRI